MKRTLALLLSALMLIGMFTLVSCGDAESEETTASAVTTAGNIEGEETSAGDTTPEFSTTKYEGTFTVYARTQQGSYNAQYIIEEDQTGDVVVDSAYKVNCAVEERFGVELVLKEAGDPSSTILNDINSGVDIDYDIILDRRSQLASKVTAGLLTDFNKLGVDLSADWWDANAVRDLTVDGKNYLMGNSVSVAKLLGSRFFYFNKAIIADYNLTDPYTLLEADNWTLEEFCKLVKGVSAPTSDGSLGTYGLVLETGESNGVYMHMIVGCGVTYSKTESDGTITCTLGDQIEKIDNIFSTLGALFKDTNYVLTMDQAVAADTNGEAASADGKYNKARALWASGHFLFTHTSMATSSQFTEMTDDYGCLPNPKYNKDQTDYVHKCDKYTIMWAIPNSSAIDLQKVADIMDYWGYYAEQEVYPSYYEITIKTKRFSETKASEVIDIVRRTTRYELLDIFGVANCSAALSTGWDNGSVSSKWSSYSSAISKQVSKLNSQFSSLE